MRIIHNVTVLPVSGPAIREGAVALEAGRVVAVGRAPGGDFDSLGLGRATATATLIDGEGGMLTPGLIDAHTHLGVSEEAIGAAGDDVNETTGPVTPDLRALDGINPDETALGRALRAGVTAVCVLPGSANVIGGSGAVIRTHGTVVDRMLLRENVGMKAAFGENPKRFYGSKDKAPATRMAIAALYREWLTKARDYDARKARAQEKGDSVETDVKLEALLPVVRGEIPLRAHAHRADDIATAIRIAREFGLRLVIEHCTEGHKVVDLLLEHGIPAVVGPSMGARGKVELREKGFETAGVLARAGVLVALTTDHGVMHIEHLQVAAALAVKAGMTEEQALAAVTLSPARILGLEERLGSIDRGKEADLVLWSGDPLDVRSYPRRVWVAGEEVVTA